MAAHWIISHSTLERWRWTAEAPKFIKLGGRVIYGLEGVEALEDEQFRGADHEPHRPMSVKGDDLTISNHITIADIPRMPVSEIAALTADLLAMPEDVADQQLAQAKSLSNWLDGAISLKHADRAQTSRHGAGKETGTIRFEDDGVTVIAELPRRIDWDRAKFAQIADNIASGGEARLVNNCFGERGSRRIAHRSRLAVGYPSVYWDANSRRGGRVVEGARLERV